MLEGIFLVLITLFVIWAMQKLFCSTNISCRNLTPEEIKVLNRERQSAFDYVYRQLGYVVVDDADRSKEQLLKNKCRCLLNEECVKINLPKYDKYIESTESCHCYLGPSNRDYPRCLLTNHNITRYLKIPR